MTSDKKISDKKISVAFVCLGNICRSPMAEAVFKNVVKEAGLLSRFDKIDSFGTALYHVGETPDHRSVECCHRHGVPVNHRAQKLTLNEFSRFDFLLVMDQSNLRDVERLRPVDNDTTQVKLFGEYRGDDTTYGKIIEDPYYGGTIGFEKNFNQITKFSKNFIDIELN